MLLVQVPGCLPEVDSFLLIHPPFLPEVPAFATGVKAVTAVSQGMETSEIRVEMNLSVPPMC